MKKNEFFGFFSRISKAIFNSYPYSQNEKVDEIFRNGDYNSFLKEKLYDIESYNSSLRKMKWYSFNNLGAIASIIGLIVTIGITLLPNSYSSSKLFILILLGIVIVPYGISIILIWNDKKNYSFYYETILNLYVKDLEAKNHQLKEINLSESKELNETIEELYAQNQLYSQVISYDTHYLAESYREIEFHISNKSDENKIKKCFSFYLDKLCRISHKLMLFNSALDDTTLKKYSSCIKLIHPDDIFNQSKLDDLRFKTFVRSNYPNDELYKERLKIIATQYDSKYEKIIENDNFKDIIDKKKWYYYIPDYPTYYTDKNYQTSHPESIKFYKSAIAFPIVYRYAEEAYILGFLCFDNPTSEAFPNCKKGEYDEGQQIWQEFCCSQLDILSILISKIVNYSVNKPVNNLLVLKKLRDINLSIFDLS